MVNGDFTGKIINTGNAGLAVSPFKATNWTNDTTTLAGLQPAAYASTDWADDDDNANPNAYGFKTETENW